ALLHVQHAGGDERADGLADGEAADAEAGGQLRLARQRPTDRERAIEHEVEQLFGHHIGSPGAHSSTLEGRRAGGRAYRDASPTLGACGTAETDSRTGCASAPSSPATCRSRSPTRGRTTTRWC